MNTRTLTLAGIAMVAVVALGVLGTWRITSAVQEDVDNDGVVTILDIFQVARAFGNEIPTPTPVPLIRESHIIMTDDGHGHNAAGLDAARVPIDSARYPLSTQFRLWVDLTAYQDQDSNFTTCVYLKDVTNGLPGQLVVESNACINAPPTSGSRHRLFGEQFQLTGARKVTHWASR